MIGKRRERKEFIRVAWSWGDDEDYDGVDLRDGQKKTFKTDGPYAYDLVRVERVGDKIVVKPCCMMIQGNPVSLRRYAEILEKTQ